MRTWRWGIVCAGACFLLPGQSWADEGLFDRLDKNKDGQIAADEVEANDKGLFERLLRNHDKDGDGKLSRDEFAAGTTTPPKEATPGLGAGGPPREAPEFMKMNAAEIFKRLDKNGDGKITKEEAGERVKEHFDEIDTNKDGGIDSAEFTKSHEEFMKRLGGAAPGGRPGADFAEQIFKRLDKNGDGKISKDEVDGDAKERLDRLFQRLGGDSITKEQFLKALAEMRPREGAGDKKPEASPGAPAGDFRPMVNLPVLKALDANGDGELSSEEIANATKALNTLDKNGDGKLTRDELLPALGPGGPGGPGGGPGEFLKNMFRQADKNGDGKLSKDEVPPFMAERFAKMDTNGDGQIDESEMRAAAGKMMERLGEAGEKLRPRKPEEK